MMDILGYEFMQKRPDRGHPGQRHLAGSSAPWWWSTASSSFPAAIAHASYGGVGLAFMLGLPVLPVTTAFTVFAALIMALVTLRARERSDTVIGAIWAAGMALGIILLDLTPGYNVDLMSYLFGSILAVTRSDLWLMAGLAVLVFGLVLVFFRGFLAMSFDEEFARSRGVPVDFLHCLLIVLVGLCVVMIIRGGRPDPGHRPADHSAVHCGEANQIVEIDDDHLDGAERFSSPSPGCGSPIPWTSPPARPSSRWPP